MKGIPMALRHFIEDDLARKLESDVRRAVVHYVDMCKLADIPTREVWAAIVAVLARDLISVAIKAGLSQKSFLLGMGEEWNRVKKEHKNAPGRAADQGR
jgi:hypothetical protein